MTFVSMIKGATKGLLQSDHGRKVYDKLTIDFPTYFKSCKKNKSKKNSTSLIEGLEK